MTRVLRHRGPDGAATWREQGVGLAHTRLAVIDLTARAAQPMIDDSDRYVVIFNGEIYNFAELRRELQALGDRFHSDADTEVLLLGYRRWGKGVLDRLEGMFAFAILDRAEQRLVLARDRFGEKPLYYALTDEALIFGSEIKAILAYGLPRRPNLAAINDYLSLQYIPAPASAFEGVFKLSPASVMRVDRGGLSSPRRYWQAPAIERTPLDQSIEALREETLARLTSAVRRRMVADVPVGAFLSGGVDSSAVVALMSQVASRPIKTFCIGFDDPAHDERRFARDVAERFGTDHHEAVLTPDCLADLEALAWHYNEPFADPSALPTYAVSRLARSEVTVSLSGDGGDELFYGYGRYADLARMQGLAGWPPAIAKGAALAAGAIPNGLTSVRPFGGLKRRLHAVGCKPSERYEAALGYFFAADKAEGYGPALRAYRNPPTFDRFDAQFAGCSLVEGAAASDSASYLPDDILTKVDVASMAVSLESRAPFLDRELWSFAARLPQSARMPGGVLKGLLKSSLEPILPRALLYRPKAGFGTPLEQWLRGPWRAYVADLLLDGRFLDRGLLERRYVERLIGDHNACRRLNHTRIWALVMLELWFRTWIDPAELGG